MPFRVISARNQAPNRMASHVGVFSDRVVLKIVASDTLSAFRKAPKPNHISSWILSSTF